MLKAAKVEELSQDQKDYYNKIPAISLDQLFGGDDAPGLVIRDGHIWGYEKEDK